MASSPRRRSARTASALLLLALVAACSQSTPAQTQAPSRPSALGASAPAASPATPAELTKVRMGLTGVSPSYWPGYVGLDRGYFLQEGLDFETLIVPSSVTQTQALIAGDFNFNAYSVDSMAKAVVQNAPLKLVGSAQEVPNFQVILGPGVNTWADLRGKTIAAGSPGGYFDIVLRAMLAANGLQAGDYELRSLGTSTLRFAALQTGQVSASILGDPDVLVALGAGYRSLGFVNEYLKDVQYNGYVVHDEWARTHEAAVVAFFRCVLRSLAWLFDPANKEEAKRIYGQVSNLDGPDLETTYQQMVVLKMLSPDARPNMQGIENILTLAYQQGNLTEVPPLDTWVDLSYRDKASRELRERPAAR